MNDVIAPTAVPRHSGQIGVNVVHIGSIDQLDTTAYKIDLEQGTRPDAESDLPSASGHSDKLTFVTKVPNTKDGKANVMRDESRGVERHERIKPFEEAYDNRKTERDVRKIRLERRSPW
jgi:hypothetical protein